MLVNQIPVSVIIPCYCCENTVERAVYSVMNQTALPTELFLIEDASNDNERTLSKLYTLQETYGKITKFEIVSLSQNTGPGSARNMGWDLATQPYIAFLDADDSWHPCKLEIQYNWMSLHPEVALTGHPCLVLKNGIVNSQLNPEWNFRKINPYRLLFSNCFLTPSVMLHRHLSYRFESNKKYAEDYSLWLNIALKGNNTAYLDLQLAYLHKDNFGSGGLSGNMWNMEFGELKMYYHLFKVGDISLFLLVLTIPFSLLKYIRRILITQLANIKIHEA
jgi:teichuronic acid biosynthesis glycosyltransferase TuaG